MYLCLASMKLPDLKYMDLYLGSAHSHHIAWHPQKQALLQGTEQGNRLWLLTGS